MVRKQATRKTWNPLQHNYMYVGKILVNISGFNDNVLYKSCWLGGRKGIRSVKTELCGVARLSVWSEVQTCKWPSWCHCHSLSLASVKSRLVLPFWYRLTWVVPEKGPLNGCVCVLYKSTHSLTACSLNAQIQVSKKPMQYKPIFYHKWLYIMLYKLSNIYEHMKLHDYHTDHSNIYLSTRQTQMLSMQVLCELTGEWVKPPCYSQQPPYSCNFWHSDRLRDFCSCPRCYINWVRQRCHIPQKSVSARRNYELQQVISWHQEGGVNPLLSKSKDFYARKLHKTLQIKLGW